MKAHVIALTFALSANAGANIMIKAGMRNQAITLADPWHLIRCIILNPLVLGGVVLFALNIVSYAYVLTQIPLSVAYPVMVSGGLLIVATASSVLLGETLNALQLVGFALIIGGVVLVASQLK